MAKNAVHIRHAYEIRMPAVRIQMLPRRILTITIPTTLIRRPEVRLVEALVQLSTQRPVLSAHHLLLIPAVPIIHQITRQIRAIRQIPIGIRVRVTRTRVTRIRATRIRVTLIQTILLRTRDTIPVVDPITVVVVTDHLAAEVRHLATVHSVTFCRVSQRSWEEVADHRRIMAGLVDSAVS